MSYPTVSSPHPRALGGSPHPLRVVTGSLSLASNVKEVGLVELSEAVAECWEKAHDPPLSSAASMPCTAALGSSGHLGPVSTLLGSMYLPSPS